MILTSRYSRSTVNNLLGKNQTFLGLKIPFLQERKLLHKSRSVKRNLNPVWDEEVDLYLDLPLLPLIFKVYDKESTLKYLIDKI